MARKPPRLYAAVAYDYYLDPRFAALPAEAEVLYIRTLGFVKGQWSDGWVAEASLPYVNPRSKTLKRDIKALVAAGLWQPDGDGYRIHAWERWNMTRAEHADLSEKRKKAASRRWDAKKEAPDDTH